MQVNSFAIWFRWKAAAVEASSGGSGPTKRVWSVPWEVAMALKRQSCSFSISISKASDIRRRQFSPFSRRVQSRFPVLNKVATFPRGTRNPNFFFLIKMKYKNPRATKSLSWLENSYLRLESSWRWKVLLAQLLFASFIFRQIVHRQEQSANCSYVPSMMTTMKTATRLTRRWENKSGLIQGTLKIRKASETWDAAMTHRAL